MPIDYPSGSIWRKWDLHAHTALDHEWIDRPDLTSSISKQEYAKEYVEVALDQSLAVIAITDHNFCNSTDELLIPYIQEQADRNSLTILPGFEVTISDCGGTHLLVVFSEDTDLQSIDDVVGQLFPPGTERFRQGGVMPSNKSTNELCQILSDSNLRHLVIFAHADRENGVLNQRGGGLRARLWQCPYINIAQMSKHPGQSTGFIASIADGTNDDYRREMTYILGSDCRMLRPDGNQEGRFSIGEKYTWIKADPNFEGLRQIISEPEARVRIQDHEPERKADYEVINSVKFIDGHGRFQHQSIPMNPDLTVIVGGKSTGKSILLTTLARAVDPEECDRRSQVSAVNTYDFNSIDFEVTWRDGTKDLLSEPSGQHRITFLPQMYIHKLVEGDSPELSTIILAFLKQDNEFETSHSGLCRQIERKSSELHTTISELLSILSSWRDLNQRIRNLGDKEAIEAEQRKITNREKELRVSSDFTDEETIEYETLSGQATTIENELNYIDRFDTAFNELQTIVRDICQEAQNKLEPISGSISSKYELNDPDKAKAVAAVNNLYQSFNTALTEFEEETAAMIAERSDLRATNTATLQGIVSSLQPFLSKVKNQEELTELQDRMRALSQTISSIQSHTAEKSELEDSYRAKLGKIEELLMEHLTLKKQLSSLFAREQYANIGDGITLVAELSFMQDRFRAMFLEMFDMRASLDRFGVAFINGELRWEEATHVQTIVTILKKLLGTDTRELRLRSGHTLEDAIHAICGDYLEHNFTIKQNDEDILMMSPGKQGLVLLELFLHLSSATYPILIDQPEDNLDNRTIYTHLAGFVRKKKVQRQVIMVTHNANLVVGTDAEEVIVANQDGEGHGENERYKFEYISGSLECSFLNDGAQSVLQSQGIREHVCQVLEGGADAFRQRERRYNLGVATFGAKS